MKTTDKDVIRAGLFSFLWVICYAYSLIVDDPIVILIATIYSVISLHISWQHSESERRLRRYMQDAKRRGYEALNNREES